MCVNGGNLYVLAIGGTSAASGGPTSVGPGAAADGTASWIYFGKNTVTTDPVTVQTTWAQITGYTLPQQVIANGGVYACVVPGTSAATGTGPAGFNNLVVDGTATWTYMGPYNVSPYLNDFPVYNYNTANVFSLTNNYNTTTGVNMNITRVTILVGGTGYVVNDTITLAGGTSSVAAILKVTTVNAGVVTGVSIQNAGVYTVVIASPPVSQASTSGVGTGFTCTVGWTAPRWCSPRGCYFGGSSGSFSRLYCGQFTTGATPQSKYGAFEFNTDAPSIAMRFNNGSALVNVIIGYIRCGLIQQLAPGNNSNYHNYDFSATSGRRTRRYRVEFTGSINFDGIYVDSKSSVWPTDNQDRVVVAAIVDSLYDGSAQGPFVTGNSVMFRLCHEMGWTDIWPFVQGGTGYINRGTSPGVTTDSYIFRIPEAASHNPDLWLFMGSSNDSASTSGQIATAVIATLQAVRAAGSTAPIIIFGCWSYNSAGVATVETGVSLGVTNFNDPLGVTFYIPILNDTVFPWIAGAWNNNPAPNGVTATNALNSGSYIGGDGLHPPDPGTVFLAMKKATEIRKQVLPHIL